MGGGNKYLRLSLELSHVGDFSRHLCGCLCSFVCCFGLTAGSLKMLAGAYTVTGYTDLNDRQLNVARRQLSLMQDVRAQP